MRFKIRPVLQPATTRFTTPMNTILTLLLALQLVHVRSVKNMETADRGCRAHHMHARQAHGRPAPPCPAPAPSSPYVSGPPRTTTSPPPTMGADRRCVILSSPSPIRRSTTHHLFSSPATIYTTRSPSPTTTSIPLPLHHHQLRPPAHFRLPSRRPSRSPAVLVVLNTIYTWRSRRAAWRRRG